MAEETQLTAKTGITTISTANVKLDGSGTLGNVITAASPGTIIKKVFIKAQTNTTRGMIRLFVFDGSNTRLLLEIDVLPVTKSGTNPSYQTVVELNFHLKEGYILKASTQNAETFNIIAECVDWSYYATSVRADTTQFKTELTNNTISTANANLDGTGALGQVFVTGGSGTYKGCIVDLLAIKSDQNVTSGMIRVFIDNTSSYTLLTEIPVKTTTKSGIDKSFDSFLFEHELAFDQGFYLQAGYQLYASTQNAETFLVTGIGRNYNYAS